jgi:hypothetical protein
MGRYRDTRHPTGYTFSIFDDNNENADFLYTFPSAPPPFTYGWPTVFWRSMDRVEVGEFAGVAAYGQVAEIAPAGGHHWGKSPEQGNVKR